MRRRRMRRRMRKAIDEFQISKFARQSSRGDLESDVDTERKKKRGNKNFNQAYRDMVEQMYNEQGQQIIGLLTEEELL